MFRIYFLLFLLLSFFAIAQKSNDVEIKLNYKVKDYDSTKYQKFDTVLIVGYFQQYRSFENTFIQLMNLDTLGVSEHNYMAESNFTGGLVFSYDKFRFSVGARNKPADDSEGKGFTRMFNLGLSIGDNKYSLEGYYRRFKGFYNDNLSRFDSTLNRREYYVQPNMTSSLFLTRFLYFTNHRKYSYKSAFGCNYRQLKSSATWILGGNFNVYNLQNDSSLIPLQSRNLFNDYGNMRGFQSVNIGVSGGAAANIVLFKAWFVAGQLTIGPEQQWRNYNLTSTHRKISYVNWSGSVMFSFGLNLKRFYFLGSFTNDYSVYNSPNIMDFMVHSITGNMSLGWRFQYKTPGFYKKFQTSKIYSLI